MYLKGITEVSPRYFRPLYTLGLKVGARLRGIQPCYFLAVYTSQSPYYLDSYGIQPCYFWVVYTLNRYSVPQSAGRRLSRDYQQTEYSCFHDDHASPQALIPVIPSVLAFRYLAKSGAAAGVGPAPLCVCCQDQLRCGPHSHWRRSKRRRCR